jgi:hypothetical protein
MAISKVVVVDGNNLIVRIDRGVAGRGVTDVEPVVIDGSLYLVFTFSDGTTETVGPVGTIQYVGTSPIVVSGSTISLTTVPVNLGGTGQVTANAGFNALAPTQTGNSGKYLKTDGTNSAWDLLDISTADITGVLPLANGGTASSTASGARTNLGLGTIATQNASSVAITGGTITGITDLAVADGGTGASTAAGARTNLNAVDQALTLTAGTGLSGGGDLTANRSFSITNTGVTAAAYGAASKTLTATVNAQGQLTVLADTPIAIANTQISGLGTMSTQNANAVAITGGTITGITDLAVADGGTGASDASGARTNLGAAASATTISAGTGLSGGGDLSANRTLSIANTAVTAGAYGSASNTLTATVNAQGQLTALAATPIAIANTQVSGLGTMSTQNSNAVTITGGSITGITDLAIADGGTGASNAADARSNLGLGSAAVLNAGVALGVATLDAGGTVPLSQIPASIQGGVSYQGAWNASTNTPTLVSSVGSKGYYYVVSVAGNTNLNGVTDWLVGDWAIYNGTAWEKIDNTDQVASVNGYTGVVVLSNTDVGAPPTSLTISAGTGLTGGGSLAANRTLSIANTTVTAAPYGSASAVPTFTVNGQGQLTAAANVTIAIANTQVSGLGTMSTQNANSVAITGGTISGLSSALPVLSGGTGVTTSTGSGANVLSTNPSLTSPFVNEILDTNGNEILGLSPTASAIDFLTVKNGIGVGVPLHVYADGPSASIGLHIQPKGSGLVTISDGTDFNKGIRFRSSGSAASAITLLDAVATAGRVVTLPDATTTLVGRDTTDTLTNKTIAFGSNTFSGSLSIANGGTGQATANAALNALLPAQTGNASKYLQTDGTNATWDAISLSTADIIGTLGTANGGTGLTSFTSGGVVYASSTSALATGSAFNYNGTTLSLNSGSASMQVGATGDTTYHYYRTVDNGNASFYFGTDNSAGSFFSAGAYGRVLYSEGAYPMVFYTNATQRMRILSTGEVGIGTSSPAYKLDVNGTGNFSSLLTLTKGSSSGLTIGDVSTNSNSVLRMQGTSAGYNWQIANNLNVAGLEFTPSTATGGTTFTTPSMALTTTGLGIGTSSPSSKLHVAGSILATGSGSALRVNEDGSNTKVISIRSDFAGVGPTINVQTADPLIFNTNNTERMRITSAGDVGIGTSSPANKLDVSGSSAQSIRITSTNGDLANLVMNSTGNNSWSLSSDTVMRFKKDSTEYMRITNAGNVVIGTTSASNKFLVYDGVSSVSGQTGGGATVPSAYHVSSSLFRIGLNGSVATSDTVGLAAVGTYFSDNSFFKNSTGNAGRIVTGASSQVALTGGTIALRYAGSAASDTDISWSTALYVNNSGNVGIGTTLPNAKLTIGDSTGAAIGIPTTSTFYGTSSIGSSIGTIGLFSTESAAVDVGPVLTFGGKTGNAYSPYPFAFIQGAKASATAGDYGGYLRFFVVPASGSSPVENLRITETTLYTTSGIKVGIGTNNPNKLLSLSTSDTSNSVTGAAGLQIVNTSASAGGRMTSITFGGRATTNYPFAAIAGILVSDVAQEQAGDLAFYTKSTVTAVNPTERMRISADGNVGIGTSSPNFLTHISTGSASSITQPTAGSYGLYVQQNSSGSVGGIYIQDGASNTGNSLFIADNNGVGRVVVNGDGDLLVGKTALNTSTNGFQVAANGTELCVGRSDNRCALFNRNGSNGDSVLFLREGGVVGSISVTGSATAYNTSSDYRLKNTIAPMTGALAKVALLKPCTYKWNADGSDGEGFIAHELAEIAPQCVTGEKDAVDGDGKPIHQGIDTSFLVATLTAAIQEQQAIIESLKARLDAANL